MKQLIPALTTSMCLVSFAATASGCSEATSEPNAPNYRSAPLGGLSALETSGRRAINILLSDHAVTTPLKTVKAGLVNFNVINNGTVFHDLIIIEGSTPSLRQAAVLLESKEASGRAGWIEPGHAVWVRTELHSGNYLILSRYTPTARVAAYTSLRVK